MTNVRLMCRVCSFYRALTVWTGRVTINILPDNVLLRIFLIDGYQHNSHMQSYFGMEHDRDRVRRLPWRWHRLVHVCSRWRSIIFASPEFLDLRLVCGPGTPMQLTSIWPPFPIIITNHPYHAMSEHHDFDAAIVHPDRVREIRLFGLMRLTLQGLASATRMQEQFPALIHLSLTCADHSDVALPDGFLGVSAPRLQSLVLDSIPFPALPKLLMSTTHLVHLILYGISHSGYFPPKAIVTPLAVMPNLKSLIIVFSSPLSRPENRRQPPPIRTVLPALTRFVFTGSSEYLEDFVSRIDTPLLDSVYITFFHQLISDIPRLVQSMGRSTRFQELKETHLGFDKFVVHVETHPPRWFPSKKTVLGISSNAFVWQLSSLEQVITSCFPPIYTVEHLYIYNPPSKRGRLVDMENSIQWLEFFQPFTAVMNLYLSKKFAPSIAAALQELVGGRTTEVLPILQNIYLEQLQPSEPIEEGIQKFVAARQLSSQPITVSRWQRDLDSDLDSKSRTVSKLGD